MQPSLFSLVHGMHASHFCSRSAHIVVIGQSSPTVAALPSPTAALNLWERAATQLFGVQDIWSVFCSVFLSADGANNEIQGLAF